jgi:hypothetical protein
MAPRWLAAWLRQFAPPPENVRRTVAPEKRIILFCQSRAVTGGNRHDEHGASRSTKS